MVSPKDDWSEQEYAARTSSLCSTRRARWPTKADGKSASGSASMAIKILRPADRFNVVSFAGEEHLLANDLIQRRRGWAGRGNPFCSGAKPVGGTNIRCRLTAHVATDQSLFEFGPPRMIVFLTTACDCRPNQWEQILGKPQRTQATHASFRLASL